MYSLSDVFSWKRTREEGQGGSGREQWNWLVGNRTEDRYFKACRDRLQHSHTEEISRTKGVLAGMKDACPLTSYMGQPVYARTILVPLLVNATISYLT